MPLVQDTELGFASVLPFLNNSRRLNRCTQLCTYMVIQHEALTIVAHYILRCFYWHGRTIHLQDGNKFTATFPFQDAYFLLHYVKERKKMLIQTFPARLSVFRGCVYIAVRTLNIVLVLKEPPRKTLFLI